MLLQRPFTCGGLDEQCALVEQMCARLLTFVLCVVRVVLNIGLYNITTIFININVAYFNYFYEYTSERFKDRT